VPPLLPLLLRSTALQLPAAGQPLCLLPRLLLHLLLRLLLLLEILPRLQPLLPVRMQCQFLAPRLPRTAVLPVWVQRYRCHCCCCEGVKGAG
jgi:hypothetical protein